VTAALLVLALLGGWEAFVRAGRIDPLVLPAPSQIAGALYDDRALLAHDLLVTSIEIVLGLAASVAVGVAVAVAMHLWGPVRRALHPLAIGSQAVPIPVIAPLLLFALGFGLLPKIVVIALVAFFPVAIGLFDGLRAVDPDQRKLLRSLRATRWQTLRLLELPSALPRAFTGLKVAAAVSVIGAVFAEWIGSSDGLGHGLLVAGGQLETPRAFAAAFLLFILAIALYGAFALAERRAVAWAPRPEPGGSSQ
jgi:NitT/TauT family transport system permease protein/putative hydroxymethylpyrimidine transport system permease protein